MSSTVRLNTVAQVNAVVSLAGRVREILREIPGDKSSSVIEVLRKAPKTPVANWAASLLAAHALERWQQGFLLERISPKVALVLESTKGKIPSALSAKGKPQLLVNAWQGDPFIFRFAHSLTHLSRERDPGRAWDVLVDDAISETKIPPIIGTLIGLARIRSDVLSVVQGILDDPSTTLLPTKARPNADVLVAGIEGVSAAEEAFRLQMKQWASICIQGGIVSVAGLGEWSRAMWRAASLASDIAVSPETLQVNVLRDVMKGMAEGNFEILDSAMENPPFANPIETDRVIVRDHSPQTHAVADRADSSDDMPATALPVGLQPTERSMAILARTRRGATRYFMTPPDWQTSEPLSGYLADSLSGPGYWVFAYKDSLRRPVTPKGAVELGTFPVVQDAEGRDCVIIPPHLYGQLWITPHSPADQTLLAVDGEAGVAFLSVPTNWHDDAIVTAHTLRYVERDQRLALLVREGETSRTAQQLASAVKIGDVHLANVDGEPDCIVLTTPLWERMRPFVSRAERSRSRPPVANDATSEAPIVEDSVGDPLGTDRPALPEGGDFRL